MVREKAFQVFTILQKNHPDEYQSSGSQTWASPAKETCILYLCSSLDPWMWVMHVFEQVGDNIKRVESGWICQQLCGIISHVSNCKDWICLSQHECHRNLNHKTL
jgi:hypothetical protein